MNPEVGKVVLTVKYGRNMFLVICFLQRCKMQNVNMLYQLVSKVAPTAWGTRPHVGGITLLGQETSQKEIWQVCCTEHVVSPSYTSILVDFCRGGFQKLCFVEATPEILLTVTKVKVPLLLRAPVLLFLKVPWRKMTLTGLNLTEAWTVVHAERLQTRVQRGPGTSWQNA